MDLQFFSLIFVSFRSLLMTSFHRFLGFCCGRAPSLSCEKAICCGIRSADMRLMWPAHLRRRILIRSSIFIMLVRRSTTSFGTMSFQLIPAILLKHLKWNALSS
uniref:Secreted protein n=1 Tax=Cacopsylla melanoneura TaxID=428564 RepID=A0A8D8PVI3_9HEMI